MPDSLDDYISSLTPEYLSYRLSLPGLEIYARLAANRIVEGLMIAPGRSLTAPCAFILLFLVNILTEHVTEIAKHRSMSRILLSRSEYSEVLDAMIAFANSTWTVEQKQAYESCPPNCPQHDLKEVQVYYAFSFKRSVLGNFRQSNHFQALVSAVFSIITAVTFEISNNPVEVLRIEINTKKRGEWPSSASKLVPHGPQAAVSAFTRWAYFTQNPYPIHTLGALLPYCPSLEASMIHNVELLPLFSTLLSEFINFFQTLNTRELGNVGKDLLQKDIETFSGSLCERWIRGLIRIALTDSTVASALARIYESICDLLPLIDQSGFDVTQGIADAMKSGFAKMAIKIHFSISTVASIPSPLHTVLNPYINLVKSGSDNTIHLTPLVSSILSLRKQPKCTHVLCQNLSQNTRTSLKLCSACQGARYCSRACQAADWEHHKPACRALKWLLPFALPYYASGIMPPYDQLRQDFLLQIEKGKVTDCEMIFLMQYLANHEMPPGQYLS